ncbi:hypothetical protein SESBI_10957 [Sesbania bispinosa]|nr:hypothetical protein SESBI_10957 [Sesbania bispinosa]
MAIGDELRSCLGDELRSCLGDNRNAVMGGVAAVSGAYAYAVNTSSPHVATTNLHNYVFRQPFQVEEGRH